MSLNRVWFSGSLFCILNRESFWTVSLKKKECEGWRHAACMSGTNNVFPKKFHSVSLINTYVL